MGKGSNTTSSSSTSYSAPDAQAAGVYRDILNRAQGVASTPYQAYSGQLTAGNNDQQNLGLGTANAAAGYANPYISQAAGLTNASVGPVTGGDIAQYYNPYQQNVIDATTGQLTHDFAQQQAQLKGNQIAQGALGGNGTGVAKAILAGQQARTLASTTAGLQSAGYQNALQAAQADKNRGLQGANSLAQYGIGGQNAGLQAANLQYSLGTQQQATQQAGLDRLYQQYAQAQAFPYQQTQWLAGLGTGVGSNLGGTSTTNGTTTGPAPNQFAQFAGLGLSAAGLFLNRGGAVKGYAAGGAPGAMPWADAAGGGWIPQMQIHAGSGAPRSSGSAPAAPSQGSFDPSKLASQISGLGQGDWNKDWGGLSNAYASGDPLSGAQWGGGSFMGGDAYGGSMDNMLPGLTAEDYNYGDYADGGAVMGDYDPPGGSGGEQYAQSSPIQMRPNGNGTVSVINVRTGQVLHTGSPSSAASAHASWSARTRASGGGVGMADFRMGYAGGGVPALYDDPSIPVDEFGEGTDQAPADFGSRFSAVGDGGRSGEMPRGMAMAHYMRSDPNAVQQTNDFQTASVNPDDPVRLQGSTFGPEGDTPPVQAADDEGDNVPAPAAGRTGVAGKPPVMAFEDSSHYRSLPDAVPQAQQKRGFGLGFLSPNAKTGLLAAGLGMLASRSPNLGNAIGEGGLAGFGAYSRAEAADREALTEAQKLAREARQQAYKNWSDERKQSETERHNRATEAKERTAAFKPTWGVVDEDPVTGRKIYGWIDPNNKTTSRGDQRHGDKNTIPASAAGEDYMKALEERNPEFARTAKGVAEYRVNPAQLSQRGGMREKVIEAALRYNPDYDQTQFTAKNGARRVFASGPEGRTVRSLNVSIDHLETLEEAAKALNNNDLPLLNKITNTWREKTGSPLTTNFDSIKQVVSAEIAKAVVGGQTALHDREDMAQRARNSQSPAQLMGIFGEFKKLMAGQMKGLRRQYESQTKLKDFDGMLEPGTIRALKGLGHASDEGGDTGGKAGFVPPPGALSQTHNGKTYYYDPATKKPYPGQ